MFTTRTVASFAKVAKNLRNLSAFRQNIHVCPLNKRAPALRLPLLKFEMTVAVQVRAYAKGKDKKKEKVKTKVHINEAQLAEVVDIKAVKKQMEQTLDVLKDEFTKHFSLRSAAGSIESLIVEVDGAEHTLQEVAQISRKNPKTVVVNMAVFPQAIPAALKALTGSGMNLNPQQEGTTLYIPIPKVTKEHRENLAKGAKSHFVKCKDKLRDIQNKLIKSLKRKDNVSEDTIFSAQEQIGAIADSYIKEAERILTAKQNELLGK